MDPLTGWADGREKRRAAAKTTPPLTEAGVSALERRAENAERKEAAAKEKTAQIERNNQLLLEAGNKAYDRKMAEFDVWREEKECEINTRLNRLGEMEAEERARVKTVMLAEFAARRRAGEKTARSFWADMEVAVKKTLEEGE
jgi:hypothetical protein